MEIHSHSWYFQRLDTRLDTSMTSHLQRLFRWFKRKMRTWSTRNQYMSPSAVTVLDKHTHEY